MNNISVSRETLISLGKQFLTHRLNGNLSIAKVAILSGLSAVYISNLEKGNLENSSLLSLLQLTHALDLQLHISIS